MKGKCPRCGSEEGLILFKQKRYTPNGTYVCTWQFHECINCDLVFTERVHLSTPKASPETAGECGPNPQRSAQTTGTRVEADVPPNRGSRKTRPSASKAKDNE